MQESIAVIILTLNEAAGIRALLAALAAQEGPWRVLVVDGVPPGRLKELYDDARPAPRRETAW